MGITEIVQSSGWKSFTAKLYGFGASIVIIVALFIIGQFCQVAQVLQPPGFPVGLVSQKHPCEIEVKPRLFILGHILRDHCRCLAHELQGANAVSGKTVNMASATAMLAALECAGDNKAVMLPVVITLRGRLQHAPAI